MGDPVIVAEQSPELHSVKRKLGLFLVCLALLPVAGIAGGATAIGSYVAVNGPTTIIINKQTLYIDSLSQGGLYVSLSSAKDGGAFSRNWIISQPDHDFIKYGEQFDVP